MNNIEAMKQKLGMAQPNRGSVGFQEALAQPEQYWSMLEAMQDSLCEHMARIKELESQLAHQAEPVAFINIEERKLEWAKYMSWDTPTVVNLPKIPLYTSPPRQPLMIWTEAQHERAYRNSPELHKDVKSLAAFKRVAKEIAAMYGIKEKNT